MEGIRFIFWEVMKALSLAFLALLSAKAVAGLQPGTSPFLRRWLRTVKAALFTVILILAVLGAWIVGHNLAAEVYYLTSQSNLENGQYQKAYVNAVRAVQMQPGVLRYWRPLAASKVDFSQFQSLLDDLPAFQALSGGQLDEQDAYRFATCYFFLGQYEQALTITQRVIANNPEFAGPYVLQGMAYITLKKYPEAEQSFLTLLRVVPSHEVAVEELAHTYYLAGERAHALAILDEAATRPFTSEARKRFEALKGLYGQ